MSWTDLIGKSFDLYGADAGFFRIGDADGVRTFEAVEDESDGYRSCLGELREVTDPAELAKLVFFERPIARATVAAATAASWGHEDAGYLDGDMDGVDFIDEDGHCWLSVGTDNADSYYPSYVFTWTPKAPEVAHEPLVGPAQLGAQPVPARASRRVAGARRP